MEHPYHRTHTDMSLTDLIRSYRERVSVWRHPELGLCWRLDFPNHPEWGPSLYVFNEPPLLVQELLAARLEQEKNEQAKTKTASHE